MSEQHPIAVIGGGAAGMMAALSAREASFPVLLIEPNEKLGRKLYITGKGRCNLTNDCAPEVVLESVTKNSRFLYSAVTKFPPSAVKTYFTNLGVPLKTERGGRVFPCSDRAADVIDALFTALRKSGVRILHARAMEVLVTDGAVAGVMTDHGQVSCSAAILATGGVSYPRTGSTGDGYRMAAALGHTILPPTGSLVPLVEKGDLCSRMQGLSLRNVNLTMKNQKKKVVYQEQGELLFTHFGLSGPLILSASAHLRNYNQNQYTAIIDLKPALEESKLDSRILRDFGEHPNRALRTVLEGLLPRLMIPVFLESAELNGETPVNEVTRQQRRRLVGILKGFRVEIAGPRPVEEAIVTSGGVKTGEVDPKTMMSKRCKGLFFVGELLDVDAYTGGFNLQIAWCTGRAGGLAAAAYALQNEERQ